MHELAPDAITSAGGISLRPMRPADVGTLATWFEDREIWSRWWGHGDGPYTSEEIEDWFGRPWFEPDRFLIVEDDGEPVGYAQWHKLDNAHLEAYLAGFIERASRGRGIGPMALRLLAEYLVDVRGFLRVSADPEADNDRANRACEKAGFRFERTRPRGRFTGVWVHPREAALEFGAYGRYHQHLVKRVRDRP